MKKTDEGKGKKRTFREKKKRMTQEVNNPISS